MDIFKNLAVMSIAAIMLIACGGDNGSSARDEDSSSSHSELVSESASSSSEKADPEIPQGDKSSSSSNVKESSSSQSKYVCDIYTLADALSCKCDENREGKLSYNYDSNVELVCIHDAELNKWGWIVKKDESSSSSEAKSSSSSAKSSSSSDVILSSGEESSSSAKSSSSSAKSSSSVASSSSAKSSSSTAKSSSSVASSSSAKSSSSSVKISSSSEYVPFDHSVTLAGVAQVGKNAYKQFTDERNGRSYYYITITGKDTSNKENTVTVMAENLNVGDFVWGFKNQKDDTKIERYCYDDDTTNCDKYGGLYQWAEMMQLPSRCNTESCADLIQENHQGICPDGWRLLTYNDFHTVYHSNTNVASPLVKGLRSSYFGAGSNYSGYSLLGGGMRVTEGNFGNMGLGEYWFYPIEKEYDGITNLYVQTNYVDKSSQSPSSNSLGAKTDGRSVRCVKQETEK